MRDKRVGKIEEMHLAVCCCVAALRGAIYLFSKVVRTVASSMGTFSFSEADEGAPLYAA